MSAGTIRRRASSPIVVALVALILGTAFVVARLAHFDWDASRFVNAGDRYVAPALAPSELSVTRGSTGYDGQFYYRLSKNPFSTRFREYGVQFDSSPARHQRILYPLLVWILARSRITSTPICMIVVNLAALAGLGFVGAALARSAERSPWLGLALPLYPAFVVALALDLADIVAALLLASSVLLLTRRRYLWATITLSLAGFTRETTLLLPIGWLAMLVFGHWKRRDTDESLPIWIVVLPISLVAAWQLVLWRAYGRHPFFAAGRQFGAPLLALLRQVGIWLNGHSAEDLFQLIELILVLSLLVAALYHLRGSKRHLLAGPLIVAAILAAGLYAEIWRSQTNFLRALAEPAILSMLVLFDRSRDARVLMAGSTVLALANVGVWLGVGRFS